MFNFFTSITDTLSTIWQFIMNMLTGTVMMFQVVIGSFTVPVTLAYLVPSVLGVSVMIVASVGIVKLILGWGNS